MEGRRLNLLQNLIANMIRRGRITKVNPDNNQYAVHQVSYNGNTLDIEIISPYGHYYTAPLDSEVVMWNVEGQEENKAGMANKSTARYKGLKSGEVAIGNPVAGSKVLFDESGNVTVTVPGNQVVTVNGSATINVTGAATITAAMVDVTTTGATTITAPTVAIVGNATITGNLDVDGSITDNAQSNTNTMSDMRAKYNIHTHNENGGGGPTDSPNQPI